MLTLYAWLNPWISRNLWQQKKESLLIQIRYENGPLEIALGGRASRETICHPIQPLAVNICPTHYDGYAWEAHFRGGK